MTTPLWCLFAVSFFPLMLSFVSGYFRNKEFGTVDNKYPRQQSAQLTGPGARAVAAQGNAWEALAMFTVAVRIRRAKDGQLLPARRAWLVSWTCDHPARESL